MASLMASTRLASGTAFRSAAIVRPHVARAAVAVVDRSRAANCSFLGGAFGASSLVAPAPARGSLVVMAAGGKSMACTKEGTRSAHLLQQLTMGMPKRATGAASASYPTLWHTAEVNFGYRKSGILMTCSNHCNVCLIIKQVQKRRRTSGYRTRAASKSGRKILKARRDKGRHALCPASVGGSAGKKK